MRKKSDTLSFRGKSDQPFPVFAGNRYFRQVCSEQFSYFLLKGTPGGGNFIMNPKPRAPIIDPPAITQVGHVSGSSRLGELQGGHDVADTKFTFA
jgi:hypothetical protein